MTIEQRARLAVRAHLRHRHTDYDDRLFDAQLDAEALDDATYRRIRQEAHATVDDFIHQPRNPTT